MKQSAREVIECGIQSEDYTRPEDSYAESSTVLKAFGEHKIQEVEAGATQLYSVPHSPTCTCTLFVELYSILLF